MKEGRDIDTLFKEGFLNPDIPYNDSDWKNLEGRLHPKEKQRVVPVIWLTSIAGIAAMLLIVFLLVMPDKDKTNINDHVKTKNDKIDEGNTGSKNGTSDGSSKAIEQSLTQTTNEPKDISSQRNNQKDNLQSSYYNLYKTTDIFGTPKVNSENNTLASPNFSPIILNATINPAEFSKQKVFREAVQGKADKFIDPVRRKPNIVLSITAAPDLTGVQKSGKSNLSGSLGFEATAFLTKKLSVTTGIAYAKKIYDSDFSLYKPNSSYVFKTEPTNIHANCDVLDIPLNINYKVFDNNKNAITLSTGLSSYLMLNEKYNYSYQPGYQGPEDYEVYNQNQHYLGIANISIEFQHKINNKLSISARPFMKLPLTGIGYGNSRLSSTGIAISVNMNLFKKEN